MEGSRSVVGKSMREANMRALTGASVIAMVRDGRVIPNPKSETVFVEGDMVGLIGSAVEIAQTALLLAPVTHEEIARSGLDEVGFEWRE